MLTYKPGTRLLLGLDSSEIVEGVYVYGSSDHMTLRNVVKYPIGEAADVHYRYYSTEITSIKVIEATEPTCIEKMVFRDYEKAKAIINKYIYIPIVDAEFYKELEHIKMCTRISVVALSVKYGRDTRINILAIATKAKVVLFDLQLSWKHLLDAGLRDVLESEEFLKIVYNSKLLSDCLLHVYNVKLTNVFDVKVADFINGEYCPLHWKCSEGIAICISLHLNLPLNILGVYEVSMKQLSERPLLQQLKELAASEAVYIYFVKPILQKALYKDYYITLNRYMAYMRDYNKPSNVLKLLKDNDNVFDELKE